MAYDLGNQDDRYGYLNLSIKISVKMPSDIKILGYLKLTFKYTVTTKLMQDDVGDHETWLLDFVGDNATDKVRRSGSQGSHKFTKGFLVGSRDSLGTTLLLFLATTGAFLSGVDPG